MTQVRFQQVLILLMAITMAVSSIYATRMQRRVHKTLDYVQKALDYQTRVIKYQSVVIKDQQERLQDCGGERNRVRFQ